MIAAEPMSPSHSAIATRRAKESRQVVATPPHDLQASDSSLNGQRPTRQLGAIGRVTALQKKTAGAGRRLIEFRDAESSNSVRAI